MKTRIGYDKPITELWITQINEVNPMWITLHGRTLKQMYTGFADWNEIKIAVNNSKAPILANGDIKNKEDIEKVLRLTGASGVLIGRATYGNPWIFKTLKDNNEIDLKKRINVMLEHAEKFVELNPEPKLFFQMRKHFGWYIKGFDGANDIRKKLMTSTSLPEVRKIIEEYL